MNKSILKHEIRSMKWMALLSVFTSLFLIIMFNIALDGNYARMFSNGMEVNRGIIKSALRSTSEMALILFTLLSLVQIFMQFRSEKDQEIGRFLKSLPVKKEEFFKIKLISGIVNLSLAFAVLGIGILIVRNNNMFWIKDIYNVSIISAPFIVADSVGSILKDIGLVYLVILSFYTFLFMIQYTFSNLVGGIATGSLVYIAPVFIVNGAVFAFGQLTSGAHFRNMWIYGMDELSVWLLPWFYPMDYNFNSSIIDSNGRYLGQVNMIENLEIKYVITIALIIINILIAYKLNKSSKIENENMVIPFKISGNIFKIGVTICSGLLVSMILGGLMGLQMNSIFQILFIVLGGSIGYFISSKITRVGSR